MSVTARRLFPAEFMSFNQFDLKTCCCLTEWFLCSQSTVVGLKSVTSAETLHLMLNPIEIFI